MWVLMWWRCDLLLACLVRRGSRNMFTSGPNPSTVETWIMEPGNVTWVCILSHRTQFNLYRAIVYPLLVPVERVGKIRQSLHSSDYLIFIICSPYRHQGYKKQGDCILQRPLQKRIPPQLNRVLVKIIIVVVEGHRKRNGTHMQWLHSSLEEENARGEKYKNKAWDTRGGGVE